MHTWPDLLLATRQGLSNEVQVSTSPDLATPALRLLLTRRRGSNYPERLPSSYHVTLQH